MVTGQQATQNGSTWRRNPIPPCNAPISGGAVSKRKCTHSSTCLNDKTDTCVYCWNTVPGYNQPYAPDITCLGHEAPGQNRRHSRLDAKGIKMLRCCNCPGCVPPTATPDMMTEDELLEHMNEAFNCMMQNDHLPIAIGDHVDSAKSTTAGRLSFEISEMPKHEHVETKADPQASVR